MPVDPHWIDSFQTAGHLGQVWVKVWNSLFRRKKSVFVSTWQRSSILQVFYRRCRSFKLAESWRRSHEIKRLLEQKIRVVIFRRSSCEVQIKSQNLVFAAEKIAIACDQKKLIVSRWNASMSSKRIHPVYDRAQTTTNQATLKLFKFKFLMCFVKLLVLFLPVLWAFSKSTWNVVSTHAITDSIRSKTCSIRFKNFDLNL